MWLYRHSDFTEYSWFEAGRGKPKIRAKHHQSQAVTDKGQLKHSLPSFHGQCVILSIQWQDGKVKPEVSLQHTDKLHGHFPFFKHKVAQQLFLPDNQHLNPKRWSGFIYYVFVAHYCVTVYICHLSISSCESLKYWTSLSPKWTKSVWCACFEVHLLFLMADQAQKPSQSCPSNTLTLAVIQYRSTKRGPSLVYSCNPCREKLKVRIH